MLTLTKTGVNEQTKPGHSLQLSFGTIIVALLISCDEFIAFDKNKALCDIRHWSSLQQITFIFSAKCSYCWEWWSLGRSDRSATHQPIIAKNSAQMTHSSFPAKMASKQMLKQDSKLLFATLVLRRKATKIVYTTPWTSSDIWRQVKPMNMRSF